MPNRFEEKFTEWYDRQSIETLLLVGLSPMFLIAAILIIVALVYG